MPLLFLDTETTGLDETAKIVQLAYKLEGDENYFERIYDPQTPLPIKAMAVNHITPDKIEGQPLFEIDREHIQELADKNIIVAHNAPFDLRMLNQEGVTTHYSIDTKRVAQHLLQDNEDAPEAYNLQYLRYYFKLYNLKDATAHDALGDVIVLEAVFNKLKSFIEQKTRKSNDKDLVTEMVKLSQTPLLIKSFTYGKHKGRTFEEVSNLDYSYLTWMLREEKKKTEIEQDPDKMYTLKYYTNNL